MSVSATDQQDVSQTLPEQQVAIVSGSTAGIGFATARALVRRGVSVVVNGRDTARLQAAVAELRAEANRCHVLDVAGDAADEATVESMVSTALSLGTLSIAIANAGGEVGGRRWDDLNESTLQETFHANVVSTALLIRQASTPMRRSGYGRIVTVASLAGGKPAPPPGPTTPARKPQSWD